MPKLSDDVFDVQLKVMLIGDSCVGKTSLLMRYVNDSFSTTFDTTIGIDFKIKHIVLGSNKVKLQIWDTAGQERFRSITTSYFRGAQIIVLVYDVTNHDSFISMRNWAAELQTHASTEIILIILGNKCDDLRRVVSQDEGASFAREYNAIFYETSAKDNSNVQEAFIRSIEFYHEFYCTDRYSYLAQKSLRKFPVTISGADSWRADRINGMYEPQTHAINSTRPFTYKKTHSGSSVILLQQYEAYWCIKVNGIVVAQLNLTTNEDSLFDQGLNCYEKFGLILPFYRKRPSILCRAGILLMVSSAPVGLPIWFFKSNDVYSHDNYIGAN